ncbi:DinB family protein [Pedobacter sp. SAFR-022]|uniref:DinB family protein n=1 Tax=Pedobacter sp. SAFR-022 TaxID=3436861 RepID=UPI003F7E2DB9
MAMLTDTLTLIFKRDLLKLKAELSLYNHEENLWLVDNNISNATGNLCLHLLGNLNTYIGAVLGHTGYVRNRPEEFSRRNVPRVALLNELDRTIQMIDAVLPSITEAQLSDEYPDQVFDYKMTTEYFLVHLATHLNYHLGQVNYHRRLLDIDLHV